MVWMARSCSISSYARVGRSFEASARFEWVDVVSVCWWCFSVCLFFFFGWM